MATSNLEFASVVDDWCKQSEARLTAVFRESTQRLVSIASDATPVDTGFTRASIRASTDAMPPIEPGRGEKGKSYPPSLGQISTVISGLSLGMTCYVGWSSSYAIFLEYGHSSQAPQGFVRLSAAQWVSIVSQVVVEAKGRAG